MNDIYDRLPHYLAQDGEYQIQDDRMLLPKDQHLQDHVRELKSPVRGSLRLCNMVVLEDCEILKLQEKLKFRPAPQRTP